MNDQTCKNSYENNGFTITDGMLCAGVAVISDRKPGPGSGSVVPSRGGLGWGIVLLKNPGL